MLDRSWIDAVLAEDDAASLARRRERETTPPLVRTIEEIVAGPAPCDDCGRTRRCAVALEACSAFALSGGGGSPARWSLAPRMDASARIFGKVYGQGQVGRPRKAA